LILLSIVIAAAALLIAEWLDRRSEHALAKAT
jgi:hypothetical protein